MNLFAESQNLFAVAVGFWPMLSLNFTHRAECIHFRAAPLTWPPLAF